MRKLSRQQKECIDRLKSRLVQYGIDDDILEYNRYNVTFKNVGSLCTKDVRSVIDKDDSFYLKRYKWCDIFSDGKINTQIYNQIKSDIASHAAKHATVWNKGKTKYNDERLMRSSIAMMGEKNNSHKMSKEAKKNANAKISKTMKDKVLNGELTPKSENRLCRNNKKIIYDSIDYRSSWELVFHLMNPKFEYEKLRIKYQNSISNTTNVYIVDFVDHVNKIVVEVKPKNLFNTPKVLMKEESIIQWCDINGYVYNRFTQDDITKYKNLVHDLLNGLDDIELKEMLFQRLRWYI